MRTWGWIWFISGFVLGLIELSEDGRIAWVVFNCSEMIAGAILIAGSKIK